MLNEKSLWRRIRSILPRVFLILNGLALVSPLDTLAEPARNLNEHFRSIQLALADPVDQASIKVHPTDADTASNPLNDRIRILSGLPVAKTSPSFGLTQSPAWQSYHEKIQQTWQRYDQQHHKVEQFRDHWLPDSVRADRDLIYPFAAADFLYADLFFPEAHDTYMFGLEPLGEIPGREMLNSRYYDGVIAATEDLLRLTFFRTKAMQSDFQRNGTIPVLGYFIVHRGHEITDITYLRLDDSGIPHQAAPAAADGARIALTDGRSGQIRNVWYWRGDISNQGLARNPALKAYIASLPRSNLYLKAASYLCHHDSFSEACTLFRDSADLALQEDSGMPLRYFPDAKWKQTFFGQYRDPVSVFTSSLYRQNNALKNKFRTSGNVHELPFRLGYHASAHADNLMLAIRKEQRPTTPTPDTLTSQDRIAALDEPSDNQSGPTNPDHPPLPDQKMADQDAIETTQPEPKARPELVTSQLSAEGLTYEINSEGDIWLIRPTTHGRTQLVFISPDTHLMGGVETRDLWSLAYLDQGTGIPAEIAIQLLRDNATLNNGGWELTRFMDQDAAIFRTRIAANANPDTLLRAITTVSSTADSKEMQLTGTDNL